MEKFESTRTYDLALKEPGMRQLAREVNACIEGIRMADPQARIDVIDGHGTGGLFPDDLVGCRVLDYHGKDKEHLSLHMGQYDGVLFVGQHAMAGTIDAPLCHTYSSTSIAYYKLNGVFIGEFAGIATVCGHQGAPVIFLSGDDKAACEAGMFIPGIVTAITKFGTGLESAEHLDPEEACRAVREGAFQAVRSRERFNPYTRFQPPFAFEARHNRPLPASIRELPHAELVDDCTYRIITSDWRLLPL